MSKGYIDGKEPSEVLQRADILDRFYNSKAGEIVRAMVNGLITYNLTIDRQNVSADRILGRCEAYQDIINKIELAIEEGNELRKSVGEDEEF